jgi:hypothetical protein
VEWHAEERVSSAMPLKGNVRRQGLIKVIRSAVVYGWVFVTAVASIAGAHFAAGAGAFGFAAAFVPSFTTAPGRTMVREPGKVSACAVLAASVFLAMDGTQRPDVTVATAFVASGMVAFAAMLAAGDRRLSKPDVLMALLVAMACAIAVGAVAMLQPLPARTATLELIGWGAAVAVAAVPLWTDRTTRLDRGDITVGAVVACAIAAIGVFEGRGVVWTVAIASAAGLAAIAWAPSAVSWNGGRASDAADRREPRWDWRLIGALLALATIVAVGIGAQVLHPR